MPFSTLSTRRGAAAALLALALGACQDLPNPAAPEPPAAPGFALTGGCVIQSDTHTYAMTSFGDFNDFGRILSDADNPACAANAAGVLASKLAAIRGSSSNFFGDDWLDGNYVAMVMAAADRIAAHGYTTAALESELQWVASTFHQVPEPLNGCGLDQTDNCLDGHSAAAAGYGWLAAYYFRHGNTSAAQSARSEAANYINAFFESVCIRQNSTGTGPLCDGTPAMVAANTARTYSWNLGQQFPHYGMGQLTGISAAVLGWERGGGATPYPFTQAHQQVARGLFEETRRVVSPPSTYLVACNKPQLSGGSWSLAGRDTADCAGPYEKHRPDMFALREFFSDRLGYTPPTTGYQSSAVEPGAFDLQDRHAYFGYGRYVFYGELGHDWWVTERGGSPPVNATVTVEWVNPSGVTWGPANTLTAAGYARNGSGGVRMEWREVTFNPNTAWNVVAWQPSPDGNGGWSNTLPSDNYCRTYQVRAVYSGVTSAVYTFNGSTAGYCSVRIIWVQPAERAGIGAPGSLVAAGEAKGASAGTTVALWWRDITANGPWIRKDYEAGMDANDIWLNDTYTIDPYHQYEVWVDYDVVSHSCIYQGNNDITWC